jgi:hypothetical protein
VAEGDPVMRVERGFVVVVVSSRARASGCTELVGETFLSQVMMIVCAGGGKQIQIGSDRGHWREQWRRAPRVLDTTLLSSPLLYSTLLYSTLGQLAMPHLRPWLCASPTSYATSIWAAHS